MSEITCAPRRRPRARGRRTRRGMSLCVAIAATLCATASSASAGAVAPATLSMTSEAGDFVGQGGAYHYASATGDAFATFDAGAAVRVRVIAANGDWWWVELAAPHGLRFAPGAYAGATRYPIQQPGVPGLSVAGNGRGCNALTGSFEVYEARYAADGRLQRFHASFVQHCEGEAPALLGSIELGETPPLAIHIALDETAPINPLTGAATVTGTVTCDRTAALTLSGTLEQSSSPPGAARGTFVRTATCSATPTAWSATVKSKSGPAFAAGTAKLAVVASGEGAGAGQSAVIALKA